MKLSKDGLERKKERIRLLDNALKEELKNNSVKEMSDVLTAKARVITQELRKEIKEYTSAQILDEFDIPENAIRCEDTVTLKLTTSRGVSITKEVKLVDSPTMMSNVSVVTLNSPVGAAIYKKEIGSIVYVDTPAGKMEVEILDINRTIKR